MAARTPVSMEASGPRPASEREASASRSRALESPSPARESKAVGGSLAMRGRRGEPVLFCLQPAVLVVVLDGCRGDLVQLVGEQVDLPGPLPGVAPELSALALEPAHGGPGGLERPQFHLAEGVEGPPLGFGVDQ